MDENLRKKVLFLSSSYVNLSHFLALNRSDLDVFLVIDRKIPFEFDTNLDNFYLYSFDKSKLFETSKDKYFDSLAVFVNEFAPQVIVLDNFDKELPQSFFDFFYFVNSKACFIEISNNILGKNLGEGFGVREFLEKEEFGSKIVTSTQNKKEEYFTKLTTFKELKGAGFMKFKEEIINYRVQNVVLMYHEKEKVFGPILHILEEKLEK